MNAEERKAKVKALSDHMKAVFPDPDELAGFLLGGLIQTWENQGNNDQSMVNRFVNFLQRLRAAQRNQRPAVEVANVLPGKRNN